MSRDICVCDDDSTVEKIHGRSVSIPPFRAVELCPIKNIENRLLLHGFVGYE